MQLINEKIKKKIKSGIIENLQREKYDEAIENISETINELYANIPQNKRISYGIVYTIRILSEYLYNSLVELNEAIFKISSTIFNKSNMFTSKVVSLGILAFYGLNDYEKVLSYFKEAASSKDWQVREISQMFFRKFIKKYPAEMKNYLLKLVKSSDANIRRFVAESLRPVQENKWFYKNTDYSLSILKHLFTESNPYPRTAVGNNLSDLARKLPELVYGLVEQLIKSKDKNSYWIAYRACRNLVKKEPIKVMDLLKIDEYKYKKRIHKRSEYQNN